MKYLTRFTCLALALIACLAAQAQNYVTPVGKAPEPPKKPVSWKLISDNGHTKTYLLVFGKHEEIMAGLTAFAQQMRIVNGRFTAIGDADSAQLGWYDRSRKQFKVIPVQAPAEITSLVGDIALYQGRPVAHGHINLATEDGIVHGGHLLKAYAYPTLELMLITEDVPLYKELDEETQAALINPGLK